MRITKTLLRNRVNLLNEKSNQEYCLDIAYGGYRLCRVCKSGGLSDISYRLTAREMYYVIEAMINYIYSEAL